ncbi:hypothetical protein Peur_033730 [Populus x canadensis]
MVPYGLIDRSFSLGLVLTDKIPAGYLLLELEPMRVSPLIVKEITTPKTHVFSYMGTWNGGMNLKDIKKGTTK